MLLETCFSGRWHGENRPPIRVFNLRRYIFMDHAVSHGPRAVVFVIGQARNGGDRTVRNDLLDEDNAAFVRLVTADVEAQMRLVKVAGEREPGFGRSVSSESRIPQG
jgi:hypothetical protein